MIMNRIFTALIAGLVLAPPATAGESRFSAIVADVETGQILTAEHIDSPRSAELTGRLMTIAMTLRQISSKEISLDTQLGQPDGARMSVKETLELAASGRDGARVALARLANHVGGTVTGYTKALSDVEERVGLQGTALQVVRAKDGGPDFEGYTTPRDAARLAISMMRAYGEEIDEIFANGPERMWLSEDGGCLLVKAGPDTRRLFVAAMTGAPNSSTCRKKAGMMIKADDKRLAKAASKVPEDP